MSRPTYSYETLAGHALNAIDAASSGRTVTLRPSTARCARAQDDNPGGAALALMATWTRVKYASREIQRFPRRPIA
jgi:hypothetical protein